MILYPAIDLKNGQCVRLEQGDMAKDTVFNADPAAQAADFARMGFEYLHLVDLNGAFEGKPVNHEAVTAIRAAIDLPIQLGGGIRDLATIEHWLSAGITRVILGTVAVKDPDLVREAARTYPGRIAVGIDSRAGRVAVAGWAEETDLSALDLAKKFEDAGVSAIIHTDIERDGLLGGANVAASAALGRTVSIPVIVSGGVAGIDDIERIAATPPLAGAVIGRALYDGRIEAQKALAIARGPGEGIAPHA